jgi:aquaporin Z
VGLWAGGRFPGSELVPYIISQVAGAVAAAGVLFVIASGQAGFNVAKGFAANGYEAHSIGDYSHLAGICYRTLFAKA